MIAPGDDWVRQYSEIEEQQLARNLYALTQAVHDGVYRGRRLDLAFLGELHRGLFSGVRDHAGRHRRRDYGTEYLTFGPNRSLHRGQVESELGKIFEQFQRSFRSFHGKLEDPDYVEMAIKLAAWMHTQLIRIHPFEDGNGRSGRLFMNATLCRLACEPSHSRQSSKNTTSVSITTSRSMTPRRSTIS